MIALTVIEVVLPDQSLIEHVVVENGDGRGALHFQGPVVLMPVDLSELALDFARAADGLGMGAPYSIEFRLRGGFVLRASVED